MTLMNNRHIRGIALIELTCSLFIFSIGMLGVIQMYHVCISKTRVVDEYAIAMRAIENELESLRAMPFDELDDLDGVFISNTPSLSKLVNALETTAVTEFGEDSANLRQVTATVKWTSEKGRTVTKSVTTLIAKKQMVSVI